MYLKPELCGARHGYMPIAVEALPMDQYNAWVLAQGGTIAAPIVKTFIEETRDRWRETPPVAPAGVRMVRIDRRTGGRVYDAWPGTDENAAIIWEAFKPDTEPPRSTRASEIAAQRQELLDLIRRARRAQASLNNIVEREEPPENFVEEQGGIY